jgi:hypothetical protein
MARIVSAIYRLSAFCLLVCSPLSGQSVNSPCLEELVLPRYTPLARNAGIESLVTVRIRFDAKAEKPLIEVDTSQPLLRQIVSRTMAVSKFRPFCKGPSVELQFRFLLSPASDTVDSPGVSFAPPNVFLIRAAPGPLNVQQTK